MMTWVRTATCGARSIVCRATVLLALVGACDIGLAQPPVASARSQLVRAKAALYDSNFRNDQQGLRAGIAVALETVREPALAPLAHYYAAWGEWTLSHAQMQAGDMTGAVPTLKRSEEQARIALAARPKDPEFIVMLANALIWSAVADRERFAAVAPEIRRLRDTALEMAPDNPRAIIMDAGLIFNNPPERGGSRERGLALWQRALGLFDREAAHPETDDLRPDWGRALAYAWAADLYLAMRPPQRDAALAAARTALELRPDFWYVTDVLMPRLK
jgi:hypothetical protein